MKLANGQKHRRLRLLRRPLLTYLMIVRSGEVAVVLKKALKDLVGKLVGQQGLSY